MKSTHLIFDARAIFHFSVFALPVLAVCAGRGKFKVFSRAKKVNSGLEKEQIFVYRREEVMHTPKFP